MKIYLYPIVTLFLFSCNSSDRKENSLISFDVLENYPEKELFIDDIADIEYVTIDVSDDFLYSGALLAFTENLIVAKNYHNGDILMFSKDGKPVNKFNKQGNGPGEYPFIYNSIYDDVNNELFLFSHDEIFVFSNTGVLKNIIKLPENISIPDFANWNDSSLLVYDGKEKTFLFLSKENGSVMRKIDFNVRKDIKLSLMYSTDNSFVNIRSKTNYIIRNKNGIILNDLYSDTIRLMTKDDLITPMIVKKPSINTLEPVVYVNGILDTEKYEFYQVVTVENHQNKLLEKYRFRDKLTGKYYTQKIRCKDFNHKELFLSPDVISKTNRHDLGVIELFAEELKTAYTQGRLNGKLKEIASTLNDESNNVYMLLHFR